MPTAIAMQSFHMDNGAPKRKRGRPKGSKSKHSYNGSKPASGKKSDCSGQDTNFISPSSQYHRHLENQSPESHHQLCDELQKNKKQRLESDSSGVKGEGHDFYEHHYRQLQHQKHSYLSQNLFQDKGNATGKHTGRDGNNGCHRADDYHDNGLYGSGEFTTFP